MPSAASWTSVGPSSAQAGVAIRVRAIASRMPVSYPRSKFRDVAKLYFRYGTMDSAKSMNLLAVAHNYRKQGKRVLLMKPRLDTRFGAGVISSRSGLEAEADFMVDADTQLDPREFAGLDCVLVDEAQFLPP